MAGFGPPLLDFSPLGNLGKSFTDAQDAAVKRGILQQRQNILGSLGTGASTDYNRAGLALLGSGDVQSGVALLSLGEKQGDAQADRQLLQGLAGGSSSTSTAPTASIGTPNEVEDRFIGTVKQAGLTNPIGLGAVAAYGNAESKYAPGNVNRTWNDPSQSGQAGQAGGIMSWREDRLRNLQSFAQKRGEQGNGSPETQALFLAQEDPQLIPRLNAAKSTEEANQIMANAWRFAGYNQPGGELARRGAMTQQYAGRFGAQGGVPSPSPVVAGGPVSPIGQPAPVQVAETEADVQRLEAQQGNPQIGFGQQAPVQVAQAAPRPGAPVADATMPAPGANNAQFVIPGTGQVIDQQTLASNPRIQNLMRGLGAAKTEQGRAQIQKLLDIALEDAKQARTDARDPDAVREFVWARRNNMTTAKTPAEYAREKSTKDNPAELVDQRRAAALSAGMKEGDPGFQSYILTGKMPREDAQPLTATDKKAIIEADEAIASGESALRALNEAKGLSKRAMSGPTAGILAAAGNNLPDWLIPNSIASPAASEATANLENTVTTNALSQMKAIFGGNPTEGERKILLDIQGSIGQPDNVRQGIYDRAIRAADARLAFNRQRATELRGGTYYKPGAGDPGGRTQSSPQESARQPDVSQAKQASDGNWYVPDPSRPGKYLMVQP